MGDVIDGKNHNLGQSDKALASFRKSYNVLQSLEGFTEFYKVSGSFTNTPEGGSATTYYSAANNSISTSAADFASSTENLTNFGGANCESGYIGSAVTGGTLDGFITNTSFSRSETSDVTDEACDKNGRLVAVMSLNAPIVVTSDTIAVIFKFILTDFGSTFSDGDDAGVAPDSDGFGSAPFSGYFTVLNR